MSAEPERDIASDEQDVVALALVGRRAVHRQQVLRRQSGDRQQAPESLRAACGTGGLRLWCHAGENGHAGLGRPA